MVEAGLNGEWRMVGRLALAGGGGEPVDLRRTVASHGLTELPPMRIDVATGSFSVVLHLPDGPRLVRVAPADPGAASVALFGPPPDAATGPAALTTLRAMLGLDADLSGFYRLAGADPDLAWVTAGAGRWLRSQTVFEDVVKTICTTNCAWSATVRMVGALVGNLGEPALGVGGDGPRAFPTPAAMAAADEAFYREVVRAGYRGRYLIQLAGEVAAGRLDLEALATASPADLPDDQLARRLLALPGVGPYAAAHVMMLLGRCSRLVLDSWTRPTYARLTGGQAVADAEIITRFARYGPDAGRAFWLFLTRDWVTEAAAD